MSDFSLDLPSRSRANRHNVLNNYTAALLLALIKCGLIEILIELGNGSIQEDISPEIILRSTILLGEILHLSSQLLPPIVCARLQALPTLVAVFFP